MRGPNGVRRERREKIVMAVGVTVRTSIEPIKPIITARQQHISHLRFEIPEAARIRRISRTTLYERIREGLITTQKDGRGTFITAAELQRYVIPRS